MTQRDESHSLHREVIVGFSDPVHGRWCELVIPDGGRVYPANGEPKIGIRHDVATGCDELADLAVELDAFYCPVCGYSGRVSGGWAMGVIGDVT